MAVQPSNSLPNIGAAQFPAPVAAPPVAAPMLNNDDPYAPGPITIGGTPTAPPQQPQQYNPYQPQFPTPQQQVYPGAQQPIPMAAPSYPQLPLPPQVQPQMYPGAAPQPQFGYPSPNGYTTSLPQTQPAVDWNYLLSGVSTQPKQEDPLVAVLREQQTKQTQILEQMAKQQSTPANQTDYLTMDSSELLNLINGDSESGKPSKIRDILQEVRDKAINDAKAAVADEFKGLNDRYEALSKYQMRQSASTQLATMRHKYAATDPYFEQNQLAASAMFSSPAGELIFQQDPDNALEVAYMMIRMKQMHDPQYQAQMQQQLLQQQMQMQVQKFQAGPAPGAVYQNTTTFPMLQQQAQYPQQQQTDGSVVADILRASDVHVIPNVRFG